MRPILIVLQREYLSRVKKKSFIIMTILGPVLLALFYAVIGYVASRDTAGDAVNTVYVDDRSGFFEGKLDSTRGFRFLMTRQADSIRTQVGQGRVYGLLTIRDRDFAQLDSLEYVGKDLPGPSQKREIERYLEKTIETSRLQQAGLRQGYLDSLKARISLNTYQIGKDGSMVNASTEVKAGAGFVLAFIIYIFIFMYGVMVMRSVQEEKTNRIVEILISSVKPFQLMMGKITGIALVALTQFVIWIGLSALLLTVLSGVFIQTPDAANMVGTAPVQGGIAGVLQAFVALPFMKMGFLFVFYFLGGYLLYASFLAAVGAAVDQETDTQQFMFPMTIPLVFAVVIASRVVFDDPYSSIATWTSIVPFTSPIVMVVRSGFDVPVWELALSMALLILTFLLMVWLAGRIYRTGLLMYGKKVTWKEIGKWLFYKG
jgi:ABC-2 type transport system permease protein